MARRTFTAVIALLAVAVATGCGGDDEGGGSGGSGDPVAALQTCLEDAGLDARSNDVNTLDEEVVAAGATGRIQAIDVDEQDYSYDITIFSTPAEAAEYAQKSQRDFDEQPQLKFRAESFGSNVVSTTTDAPKGEEVDSCAEENG